MVYVFLAEGFEVIEALTVVDLIRRAGGSARMVSVTGRLRVTGSRGVPVCADALLEDTDFSDIEMAVLPGGVPGVPNLERSEELLALLKRLDQRKTWIAAICAAPVILEHLGLLEGVTATVSPRFQREIPEERFSAERVHVSGHIITSRSPGTAMEFALEIIARLYGPDRAARLTDDILFVR